MKSLYLPYREIGVVCEDVPFYLSRLGSDNFLILSTGSSFQVMKTDKLTTSLISKDCKGKISHIEVRFCKDACGETHVLTKLSLYRAETMLRSFQLTTRFLSTNAQSL